MRPSTNDGETGEWQDHLVDQSPSPEAIVVEQDEKEHQHKALIGAIDVLNDRERRIFEARHLADEPLTLEELAVEFNVSRERIRQIETRAFEKVRKAAKKLAAKAPAAMQEPGAAPELRIARLKDRRSAPPVMWAFDTARSRALDLERRRSYNVDRGISI